MLRLFLGIVLLFWAAGCLGSPSSSSGESSSQPLPPSAPPLHPSSVGGERPTWWKGEWWVFNVSRAGPFPAWDMKIVVASNESGYVVQAADPRTAAVEALWGVPLVGEFDFDLSGGVRKGAPQYFNWPLENNKTWKTSFHGVSLTMRVEGPTTNGTYNITGTTESNTTLLKLVYDPSIRWFRSYDLTSSVHPFRITLREHGVNFSGSLFEGVPKNIFLDNTSMTRTYGSSFEISPKASAVLLVVGRASQGMAFWEATIQDPSGRSYVPSPTPSWCYLPCGHQSFFYSLPPLPGTWSVGGANVLVGLSGYWEIRVDEAIVTASAFP